MLHTQEKICPKCHSPKMKSWPHLTDDEKLLAKSLPLSADFTLDERKKHSFCTRCWHEEIADKILEA